MKTGGQPEEGLRLASIDCVRLRCMVALLGTLTQGCIKSSRVIGVTGVLALVRGVIVSRDGLRYGIHRLQTLTVE
jgi:hypothetical protein